MENQQLTVKQKKHIQVIAEAGNLTELAFAKKTIEFVKIREINVVDVRKFLGVIFSKNANLAGIKEPISDINKQDIREMVLSRFQNLSVEEIDYAFKMDRYSGEPVPHYQLFNAEYVAKVLKKYQDWLLKTRQQNNLSISKGIESKQPSPEEILKNRKKFLKIVWEENKETGLSYDAWVLYDDLVADGKIIVSDERKRGLYTQVREEQIKLLKTNLFGSKIKVEVEKIKSKHNEFIKNRCKSILVCEFMNDCDTFEFFEKEVLNKKTGN